MSKECFKCGQVKPLSDFYRHKQMADGHVNKCKECNKVDVRENRKLKVAYYREYDRERGNRHDPSYITEYRNKYPNKYKAHTMVNNAIRDGRLHKEPCHICGSSEYIHANHDDFLKPLNVRGLCEAHHKQWHDANGEALNP
jgi:hypothetical protein